MDLAKFLTSGSRSGWVGYILRSLYVCVYAYALAFVTRKGRGGGFGSARQTWIRLILDRMDIYKEAIHEWNG